MERNGQLTFSDDPLLPSINEAYILIESGEFDIAVAKIDLLMKTKQDYPGLIHGYRTARFWLNRIEELINLSEGKATADFYMTQWQNFTEYAKEKKMLDATAYKAVQKFVFFTAAEHYKIAFQQQQTPTDNFDLLVKLGICFLTLHEYTHTIETLEYARSSYKSNTTLLAILAEAYYHNGELPKSLLLFREAFFLDPAKIELTLLKAKPILDLVETTEKFKPDCKDIREWIPIIGFLTDIFYVRRNLNNQQVEHIKKEIYTLEKNFQAMPEDKKESTNVVPRLINKYLWIYDYFQFQKYNFENLTEIRTRLIQIDKELFESYFKNNKS